MKVLYTFSESATLGARLKRGTLDDAVRPLVLQGEDETRELSGKRSVETVRTVGLGTMFRFRGEHGTVLLTAPLLYLSAGGGRIVTNPFALRRLRRALQNADRLPDEKERGRLWRQILRIAIAVVAFSAVYIAFQFLAAMLLT